NADQAYDRSDAVAIKAQVLECLVLNRQARGVRTLKRGFALFDVHRSAMRQFVEQSGRNGITALGIGKREQNGIVCGLPLLRMMKFVQPNLQLVAPLRKA